MSLKVKKRNGSLEELNLNKINRCIERACSGLKDVSVSEIALDANVQFYNKIPTAEIDMALIYSAKSKIETEPEYNYVAARLLLNTIYKEVFGEGVDSDIFELQYKKHFISNLKKLAKDGRINQDLLSKFDLKKIIEAIKPERDLLLKYIAVQTLYDRYFLHIDGKIKEAPQTFWMRVCMGLSINEDDPTARAIEFYDLISQLYYLPSTPTLFNSGTTHSQLSSCYLNVFDDSIDGIFDGLWQEARKSKYAGGLGASVTPFRATNSKIKGTNGTSSGLIPWLKLFNDMAIAVNQSGKRKGSMAVYLEPWHLDFEDFLELKKNTGDDRRRCHDLFTASWTPDLFLEKVEKNEDWYMFSPDQTPELHECWGEKFRKKYEEYVELAKHGKIASKVVNAKDLWKKILRAVSESGGPWVTFKDESNRRYNNQHLGVIHSSNLCCMTGDQRVVTDAGILTVKELFDSQRENMVVGREKIEKASAMLLPRPNTSIVKIKTNEGYSHKVTPDHKVWVKDIGWVEAQNLTSGDKILIQQYEGLFGNVNEPELAFICGLIAGDGTFSQNGACIDVWENEYPHIPEVEKLVRATLVKHASLYSKGRGASETPTFSYSSDGKKARLSSSLLAAVLEGFGFTKETKTTIPEFVWKGNKETVSRYLEGLYLADGTVQAGEITTISLASINYNLLESVQILLANFGIKSSICDLNEEGWRKLPDGKGGYESFWCQKSYRIMCTSIRSCKLLNDAIKIGNYRENAEFLSNITKVGYQQKLYCVFDKLENLPDEDAYCLSVYSDEHSWTVNGIITKNTEILRHTIPSKYKDGVKTSTGETAVCNLGSVNIERHIVGGRVDSKLLKSTITSAIRMLDNVIDINFYPTEEARNSNLRHRPIGLGSMGWSGAMRKLGLSYNDEGCVQFCGDLQEEISYYAFWASHELSKERGSYQTFEGSLVHQGALPCHTWDEDRSKDVFNWEEAAQAFKTGMRNADILAVAPTASISYLAGCSQSIEPDYSVLYAYSTLSGSFTMVNEDFVNDCKEHGVWGKELLEAVKKVDGQVSLLNIPTSIKTKYPTAFEIDQKNIIQCASARQKWIDMGQSLNLYYDGDSLKDLNDLYMFAWKSKLKTTYYLRSKSISKVEQSTAALDVSNQFTAPKACSIDNPDCESCQ